MIMKALLTIIAGGTLGFVVVGPFIVRHMEKKRWNNGICPECGEQWMEYDMDSQGGRLYRCENWHSCDITYEVDKRKRSVKR